MVASPRTPLRVDRLRALNQPRRVEVELDARGLPAAVRLAPATGEPAPAAGPSAPAAAPSAPAAGSGGQGPPAERAGQRRGRGSRQSRWGTARRWRVETIGETWRVDDEWWRQPISRRYFDVVLEGGGHVVLFQDLLTQRWWMQQP